MHNTNNCKTCSIKPIIAKIHLPIYSSTESLLIFYIYRCSCRLPQYFKALCDQHNRKEFILISRSRRWTVKYASGFFTGVEWKSFVNAHELSTYHTIVLNPIVHVELHTMVFDANNCECIYSWY
ncbi:hypothetical protein RHMOL_Rhmol11G0058800 [Rhododendron molle]|uniref:Uncharacterized protein n=1 Tax=Rhododendron molle TaxID=49168 RepID=A0ACC0LP94_RHOML|nr:hypothetical protein RHMOL_Rhmol11G0058800 [Rhododendron molle]